MAQNVVHGKTTCHWCDTCGTLLLGDVCSICKRDGREFEINLPGDIRPAMGDGQEMLLELFRMHFGTSAPLENKSIFFNKIPGEDRTDEIVMGGAVLGIIRFDLILNRMILEIRQPGADLFYPVATKNIVRFGNMSGHLAGKSVPGENIFEVTGDFSEGDPIIVVKGQKYGPGIALGAGNQLKELPKAIRIRDLAPSEFIQQPDANRGIFVLANKNHLLKLESDSISDIRSFTSGRKQPVTISFSGGKDSLAAYGLAVAAVKDPGMIFVNTGLEFPETVDYVHEFAKESGLELHEADAGDAFWDYVDTFGPPAKDFRWCCKVCKLGPISELISHDFPRGTITVEGNRAMESFARSKIGFVSKNPFVPNQVMLNPVRAWSAAEIWGYIWMRKLAYNPLYERDFERIGCYLCASCLGSEWRNIERLHPELYSKWEQYMHEYAQQRGLPKEYVDYGFWRWKVLPPKMIKLAEGMNLRTEPTKAVGPSMRMLKGASSCAAGGYSAEAIVTVPRNRDFSYVEDALRTVGEVRYSEEFEIAMVRSPKGTAKLFGGGQVSITSKTQEGTEYMFEHSIKALLRAQMCTSCGICAKSCPKHAIKISHGMRVDPNKCIACGKCEKSCMVVHYFDKLM